MAVTGGALAIQLGPNYRLMAMQKAHLPVLSANHIDRAPLDSFLVCREMHCVMRTAAEVNASSPLPHTHHTSAEIAPVKSWKLTGVGLSGFLRLNCAVHVSTGEHYFWHKAGSGHLVTPELHGVILMSPGAIRTDRIYLHDDVSYSCAKGASQISVQLNLSERLQTYMRYAAA